MGFNQGGFVSKSKAALVPAGCVYPRAWPPQVEVQVHIKAPEDVDLDELVRRAVRRSFR